MSGSQFARRRNWAGGNMTASAVDEEFRSLRRTLDNMSFVTLVAPDGNKFNLSIVYDTDGVTPLLSITPL